MAGSVQHADLTLFLTGWYRAWLAGRPEAIAAGVEVADQEPAVASDVFPKKLLVIRDDSGPVTGLVTAERLVGISALCERKEDAVALALLVQAGADGIPSADPANPVAAVLEKNGPYYVPEDQPRSRQYQTVLFGVVGQPFTP